MTNCASARERDFVIDQAAYSPYFRRRIRAHRVHDYRLFDVVWRSEMSKHTLESKPHGPTFPLRG
jgi:hypothetical protein